jgi:hypothetical protein
MMKQSIVCTYNNNIAKLFTLIQYKININLTTNSDLLLPTDILRDQIKIDLFHTALTSVENVVYELKQKKITSFESKTLLTVLIKTTTEKFLLKYYGYRIQLNSTVVEKSRYVKTILDDSRLLLEIPFYLILPLEKKRYGKLNSTFLPIYEEITDTFLEALIENLIIQICCSVMMIILNEFTLVATIRQSLFKSNFLSLQQVEGFKNNIAWQTIFKKYIKRPKDIYGSHYQIWVLRKNGITNQMLYSNQYPELLNLSESCLLVITYTELNDFLTGRLEEFLYKIGSGVRYSLTQIVGKSLGLVWRGVLEGLK